jgi:hypothetical protein
MWGGFGQPVTSARLLKNFPKNPLGGVADVAAIDM